MDQMKSMVLEQFDFFWTLDTGIIRTQLAQVEQAKDVPHAVIVLQQNGCSIHNLQVLLPIVIVRGESQFPGSVPAAIPGR
jgi:hypothetical protein